MPGIWPAIKSGFSAKKVAAVAATDRDIAEEALSLIQVDYEELPIISDPLTALTESAPRIHEAPEKYEGALPGIERYKNVVSFVDRFKGNVDRALLNAEMVFRHTFRTPFSHQAYIEPHACVVDVDKGGRVHVWASNKSPFPLRAQVSECIGVPLDRVIVHLVPLGGDFGGKGSSMDVPLCYHLAKSSGRPVKMVMRYDEELTASNPRHASIVSIETGVSKSGALQCMKIKAIFDSGAYGAFKPIPEANLPGARTAGGMAYRIPAIQVESWCVYTNNPPAGHMRGPGYLQIAFAIESQMDIIARKLTKDPVELRLINLLKDGDEAPLGEVLQEIKAKETLERAVTVSGWEETETGALCRPGHCHHTETPRCQRNGRDPYHRSIGSCYRQDRDSGAGKRVAPLLEQIVAEELQIPQEFITVEVGSTEDLPNSGMGSGASSVSHSMGQAVLSAARQLRGQLVADLAAQFRVQENDVSFNAGVVVVFNLQTKTRIKFRQAIHLLLNNRGAPYEVTSVYDLFPGTREFYYPGVTSFCAQVAEDHCNGSDINPESHDLPRCRDHSESRHASGTDRGRADARDGFCSHGEPCDGGRPGTKCNSWRLQNSHDRRCTLLNNILDR